MGRGGVRMNDHHLTLEEKRAAREGPEKKPRERSHNE